MPSGRGPDRAVAALKTVGPRTPCALRALTTAVRAGTCYRNGYHDITEAIRPERTEVVDAFLGPESQTLSIFRYCPAPLAQLTRPGASYARAGGGWAAGPSLQSISMNRSISTASIVVAPPNSHRSYRSRPRTTTSFSTTSTVPSHLSPSGIFPTNRINSRSRTSGRAAAVRLSTSLRSG